MTTPETTTVDIIVHRQARCESCRMLVPLPSLVNDICLTCEEWEAREDD